MLQPHLLTSNVNFTLEPRDMLLDKERSALHMSGEALNDRALAAGYDGVEYHDSRLFKHSRELHKATNEEAQHLGRLIVTAHESWVGTADPRPKNPDLARIAEKAPLVVRLGSRAFFHSGPKSLDNLKTLEDKLGRPLDVVAFPDIHGDPEVDRYKSQKFLGQVAIQPTIDVAMAWFNKPPEKLKPDEFADELESRDLEAVFDHFHFFRVGKVVNAKFPEPERFVEALLKRGLVHAVHLGFFRHDFKHIDPQHYQQSVDEGTALIENGNLWQYPLSDSLAMLQHYNWQGNVTVEATTAGMEATFGRLTNGKDIEAHHSLSTGVREYTPWIGFTALAA